MEKLLGLYVFESMLLLMSDPEKQQQHLEKKLWKFESKTRWKLKINKAKYKVGNILGVPHSYWSYKEINFKKLKICTTVEYQNMFLKKFSN